MLLDSQQNRQLVDAARAGGIVLVVLFHVHYGLVLQLPAELRDAATNATPAFFNIGWQALGSEVVFFFSGFLLSYLLIRETLEHGRVDYRGYVLRRVARIVPLYYLAIFLYALAERPAASELLWSLAFLGTISGKGNVIPVGWSMEAMMQVYLVLPFVVRFAVRTGRPIAFVSILVVLSAALRAVPLATSDFDLSTLAPRTLAGEALPKPLYDIYLMPWYRLTPFLSGLLLALVVILVPDRVRALMGNPAALSAFLCGGIALLAVSGWLPIQDATSWPYRAWTDDQWFAFWMLQRPLFDLGLLILCLLAFFSPVARMPVMRGIVGLGIWQRIAANTYSIYLFHYPLIAVAAVIVFRSTDPQVLEAATYRHVLAVWILAVLLSLGVAMPLTRWVEAPLRRRMTG